MVQPASKRLVTEASITNPASVPGAYIGSQVRERAAKPPALSGPSLAAGYTGTLPIEVHNGDLWGINGTNIQKSTDDGATWTTVGTAPAGSVMRILWCSDGEIVLTNGANIWKSTGWAASPATATYAIKVTKSAPAGTGILPWGIDGNGTKFIATEYSGADRSESRYVWISTDSGSTWTAVLDKTTIDPTNLSHMHGVCYDPWEDRFWVSHGHGTIRGTYYSNNNGSTWTKLGGAFQPDAAPCAMAATDDGIVLGSDSGDGGLYGIPRAPLAQMQMRRTARWYVVEDGVTGFANRAYRDPSSGLVYMGFKSDVATVPSGVAAGTARTGDFIWSDTPSVSKSVNPLVTGTGKLLAYIDRTGSYDLLTGQTLAPGSVGFDAGNSGGGLSAAATAVAVGPGSSTPAAARFATAIGTAAVAPNQSSTSVGYKAGSTSPATGTNTVCVGDNTYASSNGTALGSAAQAVGDAVALGKGTVASQSFSENIGPRFRVRKRLSGDAHPAVPAVDEVQDYTIMVGGRLSSFHQTRDGRRVQVSNIGILASVGSINAKTVGVTPLLTVPAAATAVVTAVVIRSSGASGITAPASVGVGVAAGEDDIMPSTALAGLTVNSKSWTYVPTGLQVALTAGNVVNLGIDVGATGTSQTFAVELLGYLL
jgi:hypothetical protein